MKICVMCGVEAEYLAEANYKEGMILEPLCANCKDIDNQIRIERSRR